MDEHGLKNIGIVYSNRSHARTKSHENPQGVTDVVSGRSPIANFGSQSKQLIRRPQLLAKFTEK